MSRPPTQAAVQLRLAQAVLLWQRLAEEARDVAIQDIDFETTDSTDDVLEICRALTKSATAIAKLIKSMKGPR
jgi:hypothetical protein